MQGPRADGEGGALSGPSPGPIAVTDPVKHGDGVNAYMSYRVKSRAGGVEREGIRRFSDFEWLHTRLCATHPGVIVPPLPDKNVVEKFRFSREFIEARRRGLEQFINRAAQHPSLRSAPDLHHFLEDDEDTWSRRSSAPADSRGGVLGKKSSEYMTLFKEMQWSLSSVVMGNPRPPPPPPAKLPHPLPQAGSQAGPGPTANGAGTGSAGGGDAWASCSDEQAEGLKVYADELDRVFTDAHKQASMLLRKQRETASSLASLGAALLALSKCEAEAAPLAAPPYAAAAPAPPVPSGGGAEQGDGREQERGQGQQQQAAACSLLGEAYADVGTRCRAVASFICDQVGEYSEQVDEALKMHARFCQALKRVLGDQAAALRDERHLEADLHLKRSRLDKLQASLGAMERIRDAEAEATEADARLTAAVQQREKLHRSLQADIQRFHTELLHDTAGLLASIKRLHSRLSQQIFQCWRDGLPLLSHARTTLSQSPALALDSRNH